VTFDIPVNGEFPVVSEAEWHSAHPTLVNRFAPFCAEAVKGAGVGGADSLIATEKLIRSEANSLPTPVDDQPTATWK